MLDATLVTAHSDKELAATTVKGGWGYHPLTAWLDNTGEVLAARSASSSARQPPAVSTARNTV